ncbi:hypothetical protein [Celeribacter sp.]|uniref:hypothetical protein n=1 Tax=Celeribacter sp. TaxID=1890673 RepID=UPI003A90CDE3
MKIFRACIWVAFICTTPLMSEAQEAKSFAYTQPMEGVYEQYWTAQELAVQDAYAGQPHRLYVEGQGKLGEFHGILNLDCKTPQFSTWLAQSDYLSSDAVPAEVINGLRAIWCEG